MKTVIECTLGATEQTVGGITYSFDRDDYGRFVNEVNSVLHRSLFLNVVHYREVPLDPPPPADDLEIPSFLSGQSGEGTGDDDGSKSGDDNNALNGGEQTDGEQGAGEADKPAEQAPVATPAKKATSKSK